MSEPADSLAFGGGPRRRPRRWVVLLAVAVSVVAGGVVATTVVLGRSGASCETRVEVESRLAGETVVLTHTDQTGTDVIRWGYLADYPLPDDFAWNPPAPGDRMVMLRLVSRTDGELTEGKRFTAGSIEEVDPAAVPYDMTSQLFASRRADPWTGEVVVESRDGDEACLRIDLTNAEADVRGTVAWRVTADDSDRGRGDQETLGTAVEEHP